LEDVGEPISSDALKANKGNGKNHTWNNQE
jgi:hypothetical protein